VAATARADRELPDSPRPPLSIKDLAHPDCLAELNELALKVIVAKCEHWGTENNLLRLRDAQHFAEWFGRLRDRDEAFPLGIHLQADTAALEACIGDVFEDMFASLGLLVARNNCHLIVVSGKPSELPHMRKLLVRNLPILPQRIIQVKNFQRATGIHLSATTASKINDAKPAPSPAPRCIRTSSTATWRQNGCAAPHFPQANDA